MDTAIGGAYANMADLLDPSFEGRLAGATKFIVTSLDCTPEVRHDNYIDRHFEDDLWQEEERSVSF